MRHVIWDWNGTLVDDLPIVVDAVNASLAGIGAGPIVADDYRDHYTRPVRVFYDRLLGRAVTDAEWRRIDQIFHDVYLSSQAAVPLTADAREAISIVGATGASQSILSMWWHEQLLPVVVDHGLAPLMLRVDGNSKDAGETKERLLGIHIDQLPFADADFVMIGDALDDAKAAQAIGVSCVLYDGGSHHRSELEAAGAPVASSLVEAVHQALDD